MKIYLILLDAFSIKDELIEFANNNKFTYINQFSNGIYTIPSMFSVLFGLPPSKLIYSGISYSGPTIDNKNFFNFYHKNKFNNILKILNDNNYEIYIDNFYAYLKIILGTMYEENIKTLRLSNVKTKDGIMYQKFIYPKNLTNIKLLTTNSNPAFIWPFQNYKNADETELFYKRIRGNISNIQNKNKNLFYTLNIQDYHHVRRIVKNNKDINEKKHIKKITKRVINLLNTINFNEENSIFWIFADHGIGSNQYFDIENYFTYALVRDNTNSSKCKSVISSCDFFKTILIKLNIEPNTNLLINKYSNNIYSKLNKDRIYFCEDSRILASPIHCNTLSVQKIIEWDNDIPLKILQIVYEIGICYSKEIFYVNLFEYYKNNKSYVSYKNYTKKNITKNISAYIELNSEYSEELKNLYYKFLENYNYLIKNTYHNIKLKILLEKCKNKCLQKWNCPKQEKFICDNIKCYRYSKDISRNDKLFKNKVSNNNIKNLDVKNNFINFSNIITKYINKKYLFDKHNGESFYYYLHPISNNKVNMCFYIYKNKNTNKYIFIENKNDKIYDIIKSLEFVTTCYIFNTNTTLIVLRNKKTYDTLIIKDDNYNKKIWKQIFSFSSC